VMVTVMVMVMEVGHAHEVNDSVARSVLVAPTSVCRVTVKSKVLGPCWA